jgi:hypothetical protein
MFSWKEYARVRSALTRSELLDKVCEYFEPLGEPAVEGKDLIVVYTNQYNSFGYEVKIEAFVDPGKSEGEYDITVKYEIKPTAVAIIGIFFWPILLIIFLQGSSTKQQLQREITRALEDLEEKFA